MFKPFVMDNNNRPDMHNDSMSICAEHFEKYIA